MTDAEKKYADIIDMPHPTSPTRPRMSREARAAQFSPFAALTGYDAAVAEAGRLTDKKIELTEDVKTVLNEKLNILLEYVSDSPTVSVTYFLPDKRKEGGEYVTVTGDVKRIDEYERSIILSDGVRISISDILELESEVFGESSGF